MKTKREQRKELRSFLNNRLNGLAQLKEKPDAVAIEMQLKERINEERWYEAYGEMTFNTYEISKALEELLNAQVRLGQVENPPNVLKALYRDKYDGFSAILKQLK